MRGAADTTLQKDMKETQPLVFQPLTSPFDFLTVENEIIPSFCLAVNAGQRIFRGKIQKIGATWGFWDNSADLGKMFSQGKCARKRAACGDVKKRA